MEKLRDNLNRTFYMGDTYAYVLVNNETRQRMVYYKLNRGSPWINRLEQAEAGLNEQENQRLDLDNIERPNTRWVFVKFANITVKAVRDTQRMLGTGLLPEWLHNLARDDSAGHFCRQLASLALHCCSPGSAPRSEHPRRQRASTELLSNQNSANQRTKTFA